MPSGNYRISLTKQETMGCTMLSLLRSTDDWCMLNNSLYGKQSILWST